VLLTIYLLKIKLLEDNMHIYNMYIFKQTCKYTYNVQQYVICSTRILLLHLLTFILFALMQYLWSHHDNSIDFL